MSLLSQTINRGNAFGRAVARKTRELGLLGMARQGFTRLRQLLPGGGAADSSAADPFDSKYGTDTARTVGVWALDIPSSRMDHAVRYETVASEVFFDDLVDLQIRHEEFVFVDLGSGKGRALLLAARFPFKKIIGVEISGRLHAVANQNLRIFQDDLQVCRDVQFVCQDVTDYQFPAENLVLYLYNPFDAEVMRAVVSKVEEYLRRSAKRVYVLYHNPRHREVWDRSEAFKAVKVHDRCVVFANKNQG